MSTKDFFLWLIIYGIGGGSGIALGYYLVRRYFTNKANKKDSEKIILFMEGALKNQSSFFSLSTGQIANATNLSEERVRELCHAHENIEFVDTDTWGLRYLVT